VSWAPLVGGGGGVAAWHGVCRRRCGTAARLCLERRLLLPPPRVACSTPYPCALVGGHCPWRRRLQQWQSRRAPVQPSAVLTLADGRKKTARTFKFFGRGHPRHGWTVAPAGGPRSVCGRSLLERAMAQTRNTSQPVGGRARTTGHGCTSLLCNARGGNRLSAAASPAGNAAICRSASGAE